MKKEVGRVLIAFLALAVLKETGTYADSRCPDLIKVDPNLDLKMECRRYNCQTSIVCRDGYWYKGISPITCQSDSKWSDPVGTCEAVLCPVLATPKNGTILQPDRSYGKTATTKCDEGFRISDPKAATRRCLGNNTWDGKKVTCNLIQCAALTEPLHGRIDQPNRTYKGTAITVCDEGYVPTDPNATTHYCKENSEWDGQAVNCTRISCPTLEKIDNGKLSAMHGKYGDKVTLQCNSGYTLDGVQSVICNGTGNWDAQIGNCKHAYLAVLLPSVIGGITIISLCIVAIVYIKTRKKPYWARSVIEMEPLLGIPKQHFTFVLAEDLKDISSMETNYNSLVSNIKEAIKLPVKTASIEVLYLCKKTRRGFLSITTATKVDEQALVNAISCVCISYNKGQDSLSFSIIPESVQVMGKCGVELFSLFANCFDVNFMEMQC